MKAEEELDMIRHRKKKVRALMNEATRKNEEENLKYQEKMSGFSSKLECLEGEEARVLRVMQGKTHANGHKANGFRTPDAGSDDEDIVFVTPVQRGRSGRYEDSDDDNEDSDVQSEEAALPSQLRQDDYMSEDDEDSGEDPTGDWSRSPTKRGPTALVPREVAVRQQRAAFTTAPPPGFGSPAPPGFEHTPCGPSTAAPPGFDAKRSPPGFSRNRSAASTQEERGVAQLRHNDLRNLIIANKRAAAVPASDGGSEETGKSGVPEPPRRLQMPAPQQGDLRERLSRMRMSSPARTELSKIEPSKLEAPENEPPSGRAPDGGRPAFDGLFPAPATSAKEPPAAPAPRPRGTREWDAGKSDFGNEPPPLLPPPHRAQRSGRQEAPVYQATRREWESDAEQRGGSPDQGWERREVHGTVIGRSESEYVATDVTEGGLVDFDEFPGLTNGRTAPEWEGDAAKMEESFPALGAGPAAAPKGPWGAGGTAAKLQKLSVQAVAKPPAPKVDVVALEQAAGLRLPSDSTSDKEKCQQMRSKRDFVFEEVVKRQSLNVVQGLELHKGLLNAQEQARVVAAIESWVEAGRAGQLRGRTFSAPRKSMKGKGRVTVQFGCCYNYAIDREGRAPGIIPQEVVEPMPPMLQALVHRLVRWRVLPASMAPDSAIINIYDEEDCIPPHIDHKDFSRPFCTISLLSEQAIMFGARLIPLGPGHFGGNHCSISLPVGSCLVLKGNGADVAQHCVPPVTQRRMSITLRKMGDRHAARVKAEVERLDRIPRITGRWADDEVVDSPRRYGADDYEDDYGEGGRSRQRRVVW